MSSHICHGMLDHDWTWPDVGPAGIGCCYGSGGGGPERCTCWVPIYDLEQQPIAAVDVFDLHTPAGIDQLKNLVVDACTGDPCGDCAYRPDSPEKNDADHVYGDADQLEMLVVTGQPFWCHQGIRRIVRYRHEPSGVEFTPPGDALAGAYSPVERDGVPYKADGTHANLCAGWARRRMHHIDRQESSA